MHTSFYFSVCVYIIQYCTEVVHSLNEQVVMRIRDLDLSCYSLVLPVLQEVAAKSIPNQKLVSKLWISTDCLFFVTHSDILWVQFCAASCLYSCECLVWRGSEEPVQNWSWINTVNHSQLLFFFNSSMNDFLTSMHAHTEKMPRAIHEYMAPPPPPPIHIKEFY